MCGNSAAIGAVFDGGAAAIIRVLFCGFAGVRCRPAAQSGQECYCGIDLLYLIDMWDKLLLVWFIFGFGGFDLVYNIL